MDSTLGQIDGLEGDVVQVEGRTDTATVVEADYAASVLRLDRALSCEAGEGVSLAWSGAAPDLGAYELGAANGDADADADADTDTDADADGDADADADGVGGESGGCGCRASGRAPGRAALAIGVVVVLACRRRRRP